MSADMSTRQTAGSLEEVAVGFGRALRRAGVNAGPERVRTFAEALAHVDVLRRRDVYWAARASCCSTRDELAVFDRVFDAYFRTGPALEHSRQISEVVRPAGAAEDDTDTGPSGGDEEDDSLVVAAASRTEILRHRDIAVLDARERRQLSELITAISFSLPRRPSHRRRPHHRGALDRPRTTAQILRSGGEPARLHRHRRRERTRPVVILIDVSGSMRPYAEAYVRFAHAVCRAHPRVEVFTVGTRLTRATEALSRPDPDAALTEFASAVPDWSGGTRLGDNLHLFLHEWSGRSAVRGAVVVLVSDGWERGDTGLLRAEMERLHRIAHHLIWVNPHQGKEGYAPLTGGMQAALPSVDDFVAGHSLAALERLAYRIGRPARQRAHA